MWQHWTGFSPCEYWLLILNSACGPLPSRSHREAFLISPLVEVIIQMAIHEGQLSDSCWSLSPWQHESPSTPLPPPDHLHPVWLDSTQQVPSVAAPVRPSHLSLQGGKPIVLRDWQMAVYSRGPSMWPVKGFHLLDFTMSLLLLLFPSPTRTCVSALLNANLF